MADWCATLESKGIPKKDQLPFTLGSEIGRGAFGKVYKGIYNNMEVAIKRIEISSKTNIDQLIFETLALKDLQNMCSEYVIRLYDVVLDSTCNKLYIVMEKMSGDMLSLLKNLNVFTESIIDAWYHCLKALACIHKKGIYHRDIKPANILISDADNMFKLADFGLSCVIGTCVGVKGTMIYMDPNLLFITTEICKKDMQDCIHDVDTMRAYDYWSLGATFVNILLAVPLVQSGFEARNTKIWDIIKRRMEIITYDQRYDGPHDAKIQKKNIFDGDLKVFIQSILNFTTTISSEGNRTLDDGGIIFNDNLYQSDGIFDMFDYIFEEKLEFQISEYYGKLFSKKKEEFQKFLASIEQTLIFNAQKRLHLIT